MKQSTDLGQDKQKITNIVHELYQIEEKYFPGQHRSGLELFELLDALALFTVYTVTSCDSEKMTNTAKSYFSQRLMEFSDSAKELEKD